MKLRPCRHLWQTTGAQCGCIPVRIFERPLLVLASDILIQRDFFINSSHLCDFL